MSEQKPTLRGRRWRAVRGALIAVLVLVLLAGIPFAWTQFAASGHLYAESAAPTADVLMVLGTEVAPGGRPAPFLRGRLDTAAQLLRDGRAKVILVSGDGSGDSGDETSVMTRYLTDLGVNPRRIVTDPFGLDTYDSCRRAKQVYGVTRLLVVTQSYHLSRAVALCRRQGIEADGVKAGCDTCLGINVARKWLRDYLACSKAAADTIVDRGPAVASPPSDAISNALATTGTSDQD